MDIHCPNCGEPWDTYHLRYDEPHEWDVPEFAVRDFVNGGSRFHGRDDIVRLAAEKAGWKFASDSVLSFVRCPACEGATQLPDADERRALTAVMADTLDGDEDGLAVELAELDSWRRSPPRL